MRNWNLMWIFAFTLATALPAAARVAWFPSDVQDSLPEHRTEEVPPAGLSSAEPCPEGDESCEKASQDDSSEDREPVRKMRSDGSPESGDDGAELPEADATIPERVEEGIRGPRPPTGIDFEPPTWLESLIEWVEKLTWPDWTGTALKTLGWILLGALILFAVVGLVRAFWPRKQPQLTPDEDSLLNELQARTKNRHAHELAKVQDYNLAIHALLLDALRRLESKHPIIRSPAATGREIARAIDPSQDNPLLDLVKASEMCVFADSVADEELYRQAEAWHAAIVRGV